MGYTNNRRGPYPLNSMVPTDIGRVEPLEGSRFAGGPIVEAIKRPEYVDDVSKYAAYGIADKGTSTPNNLHSVL